MIKIFDTLHHVCIVVRDVHKTAAYHESVGTRPRSDYLPLTAYAELDVLPPLEKPAAS